MARRVSLRRDTNYVIKTAHKLYNWVKSTVTRVTKMNVRNIKKEHCYSDLSCTKT